MKKKAVVSAVVPAYNEEQRIGSTLKALRRIREVDEIIVVDDGSKDTTAQQARRYADCVVSLPRNVGKGEAINQGVNYATGTVFLFIDADLKEHARLCGALLEPVLKGESDMTIARFPASQKKGGFGLVKGLARSGVRCLTGYHLEAVLSGQRAVTRELMTHIGRAFPGFGVEVGMTVRALKNGYSVKEIPLPMNHRETGRDLKGFLHRGKQFVSILKTLIHLWRQPA
ncbi:glycosyl transferase family 2 [Melghirimyces profundicolus]|uniref:Glucosyl-3-phosphoglycerate synthase n=1 Tax=Melghirimyces profundicolus TaxID=1242148 RepID=A0A2T6B7Z5_9BACL|nr:glycosyltransferase family 2 protein [Melghirimyces profundicolus]PTX52189.1 glycosyl transferase family 2 [Melghirimyces profundicolus]